MQPTPSPPDSGAALERLADWANPAGHHFTAIAALTVLENLEIGSMIGDRPRQERIDEIVELFPDIGKRQAQLAGTLSGGESRMVACGRALMQDPKMLLLDEPTAGMARADTNNTIDLLKQISEERDITIAIIEHDMHVVFSLAQRITVLAQGTPLVEDTPDNIKGHPKVREAYLGETQTAA